MTSWSTLCHVLVALFQIILHVGCCFFFLFFCKRLHIGFWSGNSVSWRSSIQTSTNEVLNRLIDPAFTVASIFFYGLFQILTITGATPFFCPNSCKQLMIQFHIGASLVVLFLLLFPFPPLVWLLFILLPLFSRDEIEIWVVFKNGCSWNIVLAEILYVRHYVLYSSDFPPSRNRRMHEEVNWSVQIEWKVKWLGV